MYSVVVTGMEEIADLRSLLESLCQEVAKETPQLAGKVDSCCKKCQLIFQKVGEELQGHVQSIKQLEEERDKLLDENNRLKDTIKQGIQQYEYG